MITGSISRSMPGCGAFKRSQRITRLCMLTLVPLLIALGSTAWAVSPVSPTLAAPTEFDIQMIGENRLALSWSRELLSGDAVERFELYDSSTRIATTLSPEIEIDVDRSRNYDFSVLAVTTSGERTRLSNRIYIDLPPANQSWDGGNRYLPPLTGLSAQLSGDTTAEISWDAAPALWRPSENIPYSYTVWIDNTLVAVTNETFWSFSGFEPDTLTWVGIRAQTIDDYVGRQMTLVAVDTRLESGTVVQGYPGFTPTNGLRAEIYSSNSFEIFWERNRVQNIYVDGRFITRNEGTSYFYADATQGSTVQVALGRAWPSYDNGHDSLLSVIELRMPADNGTGITSGGAGEIAVQSGIIELPANGWFQVQSADSYATICEGVTLCEAAPGRYIVINHTTGERFENIVVTDDGDSGSGESGISVDGNTLSWPDNGWYQVQDVSNYNTVCEGGQSCQVAAGAYIVINHTTGNRFDNIRVGDEGPGNSEIVVSNGTVSWPNNGWYQLQRASDYSTACEGGTSCAVESGSYILVNHTSGERFDVLVPGDEMAGVADVNDSNATALIRQALEVVTVRAYDQRVFKSAPLDLDNSGLSLVASSPQAAIQTTRYACSNGGTVEQEVEAGFDSYFFRVSYDNCQIQGDTINGNASRWTDVNGNYGYGFENYRVTFEPGGRMELQGSFQVEATFRPSFIVQQNNVTSTLQYLFEYPEGRLVISENESEYRYLVSRRCCTIEDSATSRSLSEETQFLMQPPFSNKTFRVSIPVALSKSGSEEGVYFNSGRMRITSIDDNSYLILDADNGDVNTAELSLLNDIEPGSPSTYPWTTWSDVLCTRIIDAVQQRDCIAGP